MEKCPIVAGRAQAERAGCERIVPLEWDDLEGMTMEEVTRVEASRTRAKAAVHAANLTLVN